MSTEKPREIVVRGADVGPAGSPSPGLIARDTHTGATLSLPLPIKKNGNIVEGREATGHVAGLLLLAQGTGRRPVWDRGTADRDMFLVFDA